MVSNLHTMQHAVPLFLSITQLIGTRKSKAERGIAFITSEISLVYLVCARKFLFHDLNGTFNDCNFFNKASLCDIMKSARKSIKLLIFYSATIGVFRLQ
jgi:hypothetical protein